ncbi:MAG: hypothetical protein ABI894_10170 [Ilumatobacteraceae bacterium]
MSPARRWVRDMLSSPARLVTLFVVAAALVWWQWPTIAGHDSRTDVVVLSDQFLTSGERPVTYRIHEDGRSLRWDGEATSWCNAADAVSRVEADTDTATIVLSFADAAGCDSSAVTKAVQAARGHTVLIVAQPGRGGIEAAAAPAGATLIDPSRFVGDQLVATALSCQWWESCTADGTIAVRRADGSLTAEGADRVARMIVAELP